MNKRQRKKRATLLFKKRELACKPFLTSDEERKLRKLNSLLGHRCRLTNKQRQEQFKLALELLR